MNIKKTLSAMRSAVSLETIAPGLALKRQRKRFALQQLKDLRAAYEVAKPSANRRSMPVSQSGNTNIRAAGTKPRDWARYLDDNHDVAIGILDTMVNRTIGVGISVEPMVTDRAGAPIVEVNQHLSELWEEWTAAPELSGQTPWGELQRLTARTWYRDGEVLSIDRYGSNEVNRFGYALQVLEPDYLPLTLENNDPLIVQGIEVDRHGRPLRFHLLNQHPGDGFALVVDRNTRPVEAGLVAHLKFMRRLNQVRGITCLHGVIDRLGDIKDVEEFERVAMKVAASFTAVFQKSPDMLDDDVLGKMSHLDLSKIGTRQIELEAGLIIDDALPGEEVKGIGIDRPNTNLIEFLHDQMRRVASGTGNSASSISKNYGGTFSSQRQELVEAEPGYRKLTEYFIAKFPRRVYRNFVQHLLDFRLYRFPRSADPASYLRAIYQGPSMIWIDPQKEMTAIRDALEARLTSRHYEMRKRGINPAEIDRQIAADPYADSPPRKEKADDARETDTADA